MIPIQDLLHRIQWDPEFGQAEFMIGYYDRVARHIVQVPFRRVHLGKGEHFAFDAVDDEGELHSVPLHRVREVRRNGKLIWRREAAALPQTRA
jgi:uncharacterized protein (UPF0248 family)